MSQRLRKAADLQSPRPTHILNQIPVWLLTLSLGALGVACGAAPPAKPAAPPPPPPPPPAEHVPPPPKAEVVSPVTILSDVGFATPESVIFDKARGVYLVSNINGAPTEKDGNGFISKITPQANGKYDVQAKFIDGAGEGVALDAPKGLAISGDTLYVADIDRVRIFDAGTGIAKGEVELKGSTFINGLATAEDGSIYVSDTGLDPNFEPTGTDAVYLIKGDSAKTLIANKELGGPNGLIAGEGGVWVTTFRSGELYWLTDEGSLEKKQSMPQGQNDGLVHTDDGRLLVSSWEGSAVYSGKPGEEFHKEISGVESPADIGFDCVNQRVLIPLFKKDSVVIHQLSPPAPKEEEAPKKEAPAPVK